MTILTFLSAALLFGYLDIMAGRKGIPDMVSDTYYQLGRRGYIFSIVLTAASILALIPIMDAGRGFLPAAFVGLSAMVFVALSPNYLDQYDYKIHKSAAILAALGCTAWCLSVNLLPTVVLMSIYVTYLIAIDIARRTGQPPTCHPWYWAEVACFADVYWTVWSMV